MIGQILIYLSLLLVHTTCFQRGVIENFSGKSGYREIKLSWKYRGDKNQLEAFQVQYSAVDVNDYFSHKRYRKRILYLDHSRMSGYDYINTDGNGNYMASIQNLKPNSNYEINISPMVTRNSVGSLRDFDARQNYDFNRNPRNMNNWIKVKTLPFEATVIKCGIEEAIVKIYTGKHFPGRIGVQDSFIGGCSMSVEGSNVEDSVDFSVNFDRCKSEKKGSSTLTKIVVQVNSAVMTGSDRSFLVNCSYAPTFLTVTASVNMPIGEDDNEISNDIIDEDSFTYEKYKANKVRGARIMNDHGVNEPSGTIYQKNLENKAGIHAGQTMVISFFIIATLFGVLGVIYWIMAYSKKYRVKTSELPDGFEHSNVVILRNGNAIGPADVFSSSSSDVSLVSVKNISNA